MASSWFNGLSSLLSRRNNKRVKHQPLKSFYKELYLQNLEDRLTPSNVSWNGSTLTVWFASVSGDTNATVITQSNGATGNSGTYTINTTSAGGWVDDDPTQTNITPTLPTGITISGQNVLINSYDATVSGLSAITVRSVRGSSNAINYGTSVTSVNAQNLGGSANIDLIVDPSNSGSNAFNVVFQSRVQTKGNGALTINAGSASGSTILLNDNLNNQVTYGENSSLYTTGTGGISLLATNNNTSFVNLGVGNQIRTAANTGGNIVFQGGTNAGLAAATILRDSNTVLTAGGSITFQGSNSSTLINASSGSAAVLQSTAGGNISIAGFLDNFSNNVASKVELVI